MPYETVHKGIAIRLADRPDGAVDVVISPNYVPTGHHPRKLGLVTIERFELPVKSLDSKIAPEHLNMFPVMGTLQACVDMATSQLPITDKNALLGILFTYHNTLVAEMAKKA